MSATEELPLLPETTVARGSVRRATSPPRNQDGRIFCVHSACQGRATIFQRPSDWNRHMDRHDRPYKCTKASCDQNPGFTYAGGLMRHEREVHRMHLTTGQLLLCPFLGCNRSSGDGFTRNENLEEHKRRRHPSLASNGQAPPEASSLPSPQSSIATPLLRKRKRIETAAEDDAEDTGSRYQPPMQDPRDQMIKRMRLEIEHRDTLIRRQALELERMRNLLRSLPRAPVYVSSPDPSRVSLN